MKKQLLLILLLPILGYSQTQIGVDIDGEAVTDLSGYSVSLSSNGDIIAIGAFGNDENGTDSGHVRIYENIGGTWNQIGQDIDGEAAGDFSGYSVSLSSDGSIVAIGAPLNDENGTDSGHVRIYENIGGTWTQIGLDINGEAEEDQSGYYVSLSSNGTIVAIGAPWNEENGIRSGHVRIYENIGGTWTQIGVDIDGEPGEDGLSGWSTSLSSNGNIVAIGARDNDGGGNRSGHVRIYENIGGTWTQIGQDIDGEAADDLSGWSISLSSNGSMVAIGALGNDENGSNSGHVRVYENILGVWTQMGQDINGEDGGDESGNSVTLSSDGSILSIGAPFSNENGFSSGQVRVYRNVGGIWIQLGIDLGGDASQDQFGWSVSLSSNGSSLAIGATGNDANGFNSGHVKVYDLGQLLSSDEFVLSQFSIFPNPAKDNITIELQEGIELENINIYNNLGQFISSTKNLQVNTSQLSSGLYFIEVVTSKGKATKKVVIE